MDYPEHSDLDFAVENGIARISVSRAFREESPSVDALHRKYSRARQLSEPQESLQIPESPHSLHSMTMRSRSRAISTPIVSPQPKTKMEDDLQEVPSFRIRAPRQRRQTPVTPTTPALPASPTTPESNRANFGSSTDALTSRAREQPVDVFSTTSIASWGVPSSRSFVIWEDSPERALEDFPTGHVFEEISSDDKENVHGVIASVESDHEQETMPITNSRNIPLQTNLSDVFGLSMNLTSEPDIANLSLGSNTTPRAQQMAVDRDTRTGMQMLLNDGAEPEGERGHSLSPAEIAQIARLGEAVRRRRIERGRRYGRNFPTRNGQRRGSIFLESRRISRTYGRRYHRRRLPYY